MDIYDNVTIPGCKMEFNMFVPTLLPFTLSIYMCVYVNCMLLI